MDAQKIVSTINSFLHEAAASLADWLNSILPKTSETWWEDCVLSSLSYTERERVVSLGIERLSDLDFPALLRIVIKSWYDISTVIDLPSADRETVREMMSVFDCWAHCGSDLPGKDTILHDLTAIKSFIAKVRGNQSTVAEIENLILDVEQQNIAAAMSYGNAVPHRNKAEGKSGSGAIHENSLVYLVASPETRGVVVSVKNLGSTVQYGVFVNNAIRNFFSGQIAPVEESAGYNWVGIDRVRSFLTAYQINNPSAQNLYSRRLQR